MSEPTRKITVNVPVRVLQNAVRVTGKGVTLTVIEGLEEIDRRAKRSAPYVARFGSIWTWRPPGADPGRYVRRAEPGDPAPDRLPSAVVDSISVEVAGHQVIRRDFFLGGLDLSALRHGEQTARMEAAA